MDSHFNNFPNTYSGFRFNYGAPFLVPQQSSLNGMHGYVSSFQECPFNLDFMNTGYASNCINSSFNQGFMNNAFVSNVEQSSLNSDFRNNAFVSNVERSSLNLDFMNNYGNTGNSSSGDHEPADPMLKYINWFLLEDDSSSVDHEPSDPMLKYINWFLLEDDSSSVDHEPSDPMLKYINKVLLEDNTEERTSILYDALTLQAAEKPFYDAIGKKYPPSPLNHQMYVDTNVIIPEGSSGGTSEKSTASGSQPDNHVDCPSNGNGTVRLSVTGSSALVNGSSSNDKNGSTSSFQTNNLIYSIYTDSDAKLQFQKGMEEAMKFLPTNNQLITDTYKYMLPPKTNGLSPEIAVNLEKGGKDQNPVSSRGRKHLHCQDDLIEEPRSRKQSAVYDKEDELSELFDKVLLYDVKVGYADGIDETLQKSGSQQVSSCRKTRSKKRGVKNDAVDLRTLLASCVRAIASNDRASANEKLELIKKHASPTGDGCQRMANAFATGIEARLAGTGSEIYGALSSKKISALDKLKSYEFQFSACPYRKLAILFAHEMIFQIAEKASTLHIVDFGISYGFQWPMLIQQLSTRKGGPPKLRITGIDLPEAGFRPTCLLEETGQRLAKYCERFNVPFEYQAIASKTWEKISIEDLKLWRNEVLAVNCMFRFRYLLDETVVADSPRDRVLKLIREMKPDIFVHSIVNGAHHVPLFANRFREAFFYYSALFDVFDATIPREHPLRLYYEEEFYGREVVNVMSCEGADRVERPETYKSWQTRNTRAGLKLLPLNPETLDKLKAKIAEGYHKDFEFNEDGNWVLQGWKGRILFASSCWSVQ